jgi:hypothetical protein
MEEHIHTDSSSSTNTVLIVIVLVLLVGFGVWWFTSRNPAPDEAGGLNIDLTLPAGSGSEGGPAE